LNIFYHQLFFVQLPDLEVISDDLTSFDLHEPSTGGKYHLEHADAGVKTKWLEEVKAYPTARARREDSVTVDTAFATTSNSSDDEKSDTKHRKKGATAPELSKSSSNVVVVKRDSLKSESEKGPRIITGMKSMACERK